MGVEELRRESAESLPDPEPRPCRSSEDVDTVDSDDVPQPWGCEEEPTACDEYTSPKSGERPVEIPIEDEVTGSEEYRVRGMREERQAEQHRARRDPDPALLSKESDADVQTHNCEQIRWSANDPGGR